MSARPLAGCVGALLIVTRVVFSIPGRESDDVLRRRADEAARRGWEWAATPHRSSASAQFRFAIETYRQLGAQAELRNALRGFLRVDSNLEHALELRELDGRLAASAAVICEDERFIAGAFFNSRRFPEAMAHIDEAFRFARRSADQNALAACHDLKGTIHNFRGEILAAMESWREAALLYGALKDPRLQARALANLGGWLFEYGNHEEAFAKLEQARELSEAAQQTVSSVRVARQNSGTLGDIYSTQADIYSRYGRPREALQSYQNARKAYLTSTVGGRQHVALADLGAQHARLGRFEIAERYFEIALVPDPHEVYVGTHTRLAYASYLSNRNRHREALTLLQECAELSRRDSVLNRLAESMIRMGDAHLALKEPDTALEQFDAALKLIESNLPIPDLLWRAHYGRARSLKALNRDREALEEFEQAIEILERWLRGVPQSPESLTQPDVSLWAPYEEAIGLHLARSPNSSEPAFDLSERTKVGLIRLGARDFDLKGQMSAREWQEERRLRDTITSLRYSFANNQATETARLPDNALRQRVADLDQAEAEYESHRIRLSLRYPQLAAKRGHLDPLSLDEARHLANRLDVTIIDYVVTGSRVSAFVIDSKSVTIHSLRISRKDLQTLARSMVRVYRDEPQRAPLLSSKPRESIQLYQALLAPLESRLQSTRKICLIPDDELWSVPFEMLVHEGRFLVDRFSIQYAPSVSALNYLTVRDSEGTSNLKRVAALGTPATPAQSGGTRTARSLRGRIYGRIAVEELRNLKKVYGAQVATYEGVSATESAARAALTTCDLVHFGCHNLFSELHPMLSSLVMTPTGTSEECDGFLEAREIASLKLRSKLVVLAACETGRGQASRGHGLIGMTWAVLGSGASACIASRWPVEDKATARLFEQFYWKLKSGQPPLAALTSAQRAMSRDPQFSHPFYWAGFMLVGR